MDVVVYTIYDISLVCWRVSDFVTGERESATARLSFVSSARHLDDRSLLLTCV